MPRRGRASKLTPTIREAICTAIAERHLTETSAALLAGISPRTLQGWKARGEREPGPHRELLEELQRAKARSESKLVQALCDAGNKDWRSWAWLAERRYAQAFAPPQTQIHHRLDVPENPPVIKVILGNTEVDSSP